MKKILIFIILTTFLFIGCEQGNKTNQENVKDETIETKEEVEKNDEEVKEPTSSIDLANYSKIETLRTGGKVGRASGEKLDVTLRSGQFNKYTVDVNALPEDVKATIPESGQMYTINLFLELTNRTEEILKLSEVPIKIKTTNGEVEDYLMFMTGSEAEIEPGKTIEARTGILVEEDNQVESVTIETLGEVITIEYSL